MVLFRMWKWFVGISVAVGIISGVATFFGQSSNVATNKKSDTLRFWGKSIFIVSCVIVCLSCAVGMAFTEVPRAYGCTVEEAERILNEADLIMILRPGIDIDNNWEKIAIGQSENEGNLVLKGSRVTIFLDETQPNTLTPPDTPVQSDTSTQPDTPVQPNTSAPPDAPTQSNTSTQPNTPVQPNTSAQPDLPVQSDTSVQSDTPARPDVSVQPDLPGQLPTPRGTVQLRNNENISGCPQVNIPEETQIVGQTSYEMTWNSFEGATTYRISVWKDANYGTADSNIISVDEVEVSGLSYTIDLTALEPGYTYGYNVVVDNHFSSPLLIELLN